MKASSIIFLGFVVGTLGWVRVTGAEGAPDIIWEAPTPSGLANSIQGVGWSPAGILLVILLLWLLTGHRI